MGNIKIFLTNLGRYNEGMGALMGEWVRLPVPDEKLDEVLARIGINDDYEEYFVSNFEAPFANLNISVYASLEELNNFATQLDELEEWDTEKLCAVLEMESPTGIAGILDIIDHLDDFDLLVGIEDDEGLGEYYTEEICTLEAVPAHLRSYFDYEAYGRDIRLESVGCFTSYGYVEDRR